jgi:hypothetical protein
VRRGVAAAVLLMLTLPVIYSRLWQGTVGQQMQLVVQRDSRLQAVTVRPADRYRVYRTSDK